MGARGLRARSGCRHQQLQGRDGKRAGGNSTSAVTRPLERQSTRLSLGMDALHAICETERNYVGAGQRHRVGFGTGVGLLEISVENMQT